MTEDTIQLVDYALFPLRVIAWTLSLPIRGLTLIIIKIRIRRYDPEKITCPGCGFRGDSGTAGKSCRIEFTLVANEQKAATKHVCFRCGAPYYTKLLTPADRWIGTTLQTRLERVKAAASKEVL